MKSLLINWCILLLSFVGYSQQEIKFGYRFFPKHFGKDKMELFLKDEKSYRPIGFKDYLRGTIDKRSGDTLFVQIWPGIDIKKDSIVFCDTCDRKDDEFIIRIHDWPTGRMGYKFIDVPFKQRQFTATNIPFRVKFRDSTVAQSEFLNINVAYLWMWGNNRIYESRFVKNRSRSFGVGPFLGFSTIENPETGKDEFGLNIGANVVWSWGKLNVVIAAGAENGFTRHTRKLNPYVGFGFGFGLIELFDPVIEKE